MHRRDGTVAFLSGLTTIALILLFSAAVYSAPPGIETANGQLGALTWTNSGPETGLHFYVRMVDHEEAIADGGVSHIVTVTYPNGGPTKTLPFVGRSGANGAIYEFHDATISQSIDAVTYSGDYVFKAIRNSDGEWSEATDNVQINWVDALDVTTFSPSLNPPQSITAYFDDVYVNGNLFDDFSTCYDSNKWEPYPSEATCQDGKLRFMQLNSIGRGDTWLALKNPAGINEIKTTARIESATSNASKARIRSYFCRVGSNDILASLEIRDTEAVYSVRRERTEGTHYISEPIIDQASLGSLTLGNRYDISLHWDEPSATITYELTGLDDTVHYTANYTVNGTIVSPSIQWKGIGVSSWIEVSTTTPTFDWQEVAGAYYYNVVILSQGRRYYSGFAKIPPYTLPSGILRPYGVYKYRIEASKDHWFFDWDNVAVSNDNETNFAVSTSAEAQDPYIDLHISAFTFTGQLIDSWTFFLIRIFDAQGVPSNIKSVQVLFPDSSTSVDLYLDYAESSTIGRYRGSYYGPYQEGEYTFTVIDKDGHKASRTDVLSPNPIGYPAQSSLSPAHTAVLGGTAVNFDWDDVPGASVYYLSVQDKTGARVFAAATTESEYKLPAGLLKESAYYRYSVETYREFPENGLDNISQIPESTGNGGGFFTTGKYGTNPPIMSLDKYGVAVFQAPHPVTGSPVYQLEFMAKITDADGVPENIEKVEVTFPDGVTKRLLKYWSEPDPNYFHFEIYPDPVSIPTGIYSFKVRDFEGHEIIMQDTLASAVTNVLTAPTGLSPADRATLDNTTPTISWNAVPGATYYRVRIMEGWRLITILWSPELTTTHYTVPPGILSPHTAYSYRVYAFRDPIGSEVDFYSANRYFSRANYHFTTGNQTPCGSISGQIVTEVTGQSAPVVGATVTIVELGQTTISGSDGSFLFTAAPIGTYTLKVEKSNFQTLTFNNIQVSDGQTTVAPQSLMGLLPWPTPGDSNQNGTIGLEDAIYILQVISGAR